MLATSAGSSARLGVTATAGSNLLLRHAAKARPRRASTQRTYVTNAPTPSSGMHFYQNRQLELYASREAKRLSLRQLVRALRCSGAEDVRV
jgi:hypothetical protein